MSSPVMEAGAIVVRPAGGTVHVLVVRSSDGRNWLFPKGHIEDGETAERAAVREVREEAGVEGIVLAPLGTTDYRRGGQPMRVEFFLLEYVRPVEPDEVREKRWGTCEEVLRWLSFENLKPIAERACAEAQAHFSGRR